MILAVDVHYWDEDDTARAGGVVFSDWSDDAAADRLTHLHHGLEDYVSGQFYRRELPCLLPLIGLAEKTHALSTIVVDGYVDLADGPGLGRHLYNALGNAYPVVGVAKTPFAGAEAVAVTRGNSTRSLWVTATGDADEAARHVRSMAGADRIPTLLREADRLARGTDL